VNIDEILGNEWCVTAGTQKLPLKIASKGLRYVPVVVAFVLACGPAYPWGNDGHHTTGAMADTLIKGTNAAAQVKKLLKDGTLQKYAIWADCAKHYCKDWFTVEMSQFGAANPTHHNYHFTDIPCTEMQCNL
jgi:hypothetical protein